MIISITLRTRPHLVYERKLYKVKWDKDRESEGSQKADCKARCITTTLKMYR